MTREEEVMLKALDKAVANGFDKEYNWFWREWVDQQCESGYNDLIFQHDFCKAFWGSEWKHHIYKLAIAENRIEYIAGFVE